MWYKKLKTHVNVFTTSLSSNPQSKTSQDFLHTCQHLEIRNQDTFIIALSSPPPPPPPRLTKASHQTPPCGFIGCRGRGRSKQINCALRSPPKSTSYSYTYLFGSIMEISSQFAENRPGKILISVLNQTLKTEMFYQLKF